MSAIQLTGPLIAPGGIGTRVSVELRIDDEVHDWWYETTDRHPSHVLDPFLAGCLVPAMKLGLPIHLHGPVTQEFLGQVPSIQRVFELWRVDAWHQHNPGRFRRVEVHADQIAPPVVGTGTATMFSGGVDSFYTALTHAEDLDSLIYIDDFESVFPDDVREGIYAHVSAAADALGKRLVRVRTNGRSIFLSGMSWLTYSGGFICSVAILHAPQFRTVLIPSAEALGYHSRVGYSPYVDGRYSAGGQSIVHDDIEVTRFEKTARIAQSPVALQHLRVCWQPEVNCGRCPKCVRTLLTLDALGVRDQATAFPPVPDLLDLVAERGQSSPGTTLRFYDEVEDYLVDRDERPDLVAAIRLAHAGPARTISREEALVALTPMSVRRAGRRIRSLRARLGQRSDAETDASSLSAP